MPSVSAQIARLGAIAATAALLAGAAAGCSTTQEKAEAQQAKAQRILDARAKRQEQKHGKGKQHDPGKQAEKGNDQQ